MPCPRLVVRHEHAGNGISSVELMQDSARDSNAPSGMDLCSPRTTFQGGGGDWRVGALKNPSVD